MNFFNLAIFLFILSAFALGVGTQELELGIIDSAIDNASEEIYNITLDAPNNSEIPNAEGIFEIVEQGVKFVGVFVIEILRAGVHFGHDNPQYFTPEFIFKLMKLIIFAVIVSLLIKPIFYILIFLVLIGIWIKDKIKNKKQKQ